MIRGECYNTIFRAVYLQKNDHFRATICFEWTATTESNISEHCTMEAIMLISNRMKPSEILKNDQEIDPSKKCTFYIIYAFVFFWGGFLDAEKFFLAQKRGNVLEILQMHKLYIFLIFFKINHP